MSLSKAPPVPVEEPRKPKCARCRHHGLVVPKKGHMKHCAFLKCGCWKCLLITQRTRVAAEQRNLNKAQKKEDEHRVRPGVITRDQAAERTHSAATSGGRCPQTDMSDRDRPAPGGQHVEEEKPLTPLDCFNAVGQTAPLPVIHFPWMQWLPPVPAGIYSNGLCGPPTFPQFQSGAVHYPPTPEPGPPADCRLVFFTLQPPQYLKELKSIQQPHTD